VLNYNSMIILLNHCTQKTILSVKGLSVYILLKWKIEAVFLLFIAPN